jgi:hypothetical protein
LGRSRANGLLRPTPYRTPIAHTSPASALHDSVALLPPASTGRVTCRPIGPPHPPSLSFCHARAGAPFFHGFLSSSLRHRSRPSTLISTFLFRAVLSKMKCVGIALSICGCLASTLGCRCAAESGGFEAAPPLTPCSRCGP